MARDTGIRPHQLTFGSLFKTIFAASVLFWFVIGIVFSVMAYFGAETVSWNGAPLTGVAGLIGGLVISLVLGLLFGGLGSVVLALTVKLLGGLLPLGTLQSTRPAETAATD